MRGKMIVRGVAIYALAVLISWTTVSGERRNRRNVFQATGDKTDGNGNYGSLVKVSSSVDEGNSGSKIIEPGEDIYQIVNSKEASKDDPDGEMEFLERYNSFDKRAPSSYKLKYGGLGKRKLGSNKLRFGGLGKRVPIQNDEVLTDFETQQQREHYNGNEKDLFEMAHLLLSNNHPNYKESKDIDEFLESFDFDDQINPRQQRSKLGKGLRYSGLGKRSVARSQNN